MTVADEVLSSGNKTAKLAEWFRMSQREFGEILGIDRGTVAAYKARKNANPSMDKIRKLSDRYGIPMEWFFNERDDDPPVSRDPLEAEALAARKSTDTDGAIVAVNPSDLTYEEEDMASGDTVELPMWQGVVAGMNECHFTEARRPRRIQVPAFFVSRKKPEKFIVCLPKGISMAPRIVSPDRVITMLTPEPLPNTIVVARRDDGINFLKVLRMDRMGRMELHSLHPEFAPIVDLTDWVLRGVVVGIWKPYMQDGPNIEYNGGSPLRA